MNTPSHWLYPSSIPEAIQAQRIMAERVITQDEACTPHLIVGMDVSNFLRDPKQMIYASSVLLSQTHLEVIASSSVFEQQTFPYIPGLLGFREAPALIRSYQGLPQKGDVLMIDGHGISHPRGLGIASHVGVILDTPTIGVAKSILVGAPITPLGNEVGSQVPLVWKEKTIGMLVRTKLRANPIIVSIGHRMSLQRAIEIVMKSLRSYRLPEPTRHAHLTANEFRRTHAVR